MNKQIPKTMDLPNRKCTTCKLDCATCIKCKGEFCNCHLVMSDRGNQRCKNCGYNTLQYQSREFEVLPFIPKQNYEGHCCAIYFCSPFQDGMMEWFPKKQDYVP